jgi:hypothetical protein
MKRKILITAMLFAMTVFVLPTDSYAAAEQEGRRNRSSSRGQDGRLWDNDDRRGRRRYQRRNRSTRGYRNSGQYRRTPVGNRRFRTVKRYFWSNGTRRSRNVRVYY